MFDQTPEPALAPARHDADAAAASDGDAPAPRRLAISGTRPRLLLRAARLGAALYRRERDLPRLLPGCTPAGRRARDVADRLVPLEAALDAQRRARAPEWSAGRHVAALAALLAERAAAEAAAARPALG